MNRTRQSPWRPSGRAALVATIAAAAAVGAADPASAATVSGCAQGWSTTPGTCIRVETGAKNTANRTQEVKTITVQAPRGASSGALEAWAGDGPSGIAWYTSGNGTSVTWNVNKSIKTNSGVCGAYTWPGTSNRSIACITITV
ncbi:hypothetical protein ACFY36_43850 [Actinoplanes sp. NPDC000266]